MSTRVPGAGSHDPPAALTPVVLSVAFPYAQVGEAAVGGAEVILSSLEAALPELGFASVVVANSFSRPRGRLYPVPVPSGEITDEVRRNVEAAVQEQIDRALDENPVSLVHLHGLDFVQYRFPDHLPVIVTLHLPPSWYPATVWALPNTYHFVCVSDTERQACPAALHDRMTVIENGVPLPETGVLRTTGRYALLMARICAEKNLHTGLDAARLAGIPGILAGETFPYASHQRYFSEQIQPRLTAAGKGHADRQKGEAQAEIRFLGSVTGAAKARLLARAACLLLPSLAPETSSLVAMEALAAGVPVIAMASGAIPEIVQDGVTGFLVDPALGSGPDAARAMADAIARLPTLDRRTCRAVAEERFGLHRMLQRYGSLYFELARIPEANGLAQTGKVASAEPLTGVARPRYKASRTHEVQSTEELQSLAEEWAALWRRDRRATPFQHPAWLLPWWRQFGPDGTLHSLTMRDSEGRLLGLLPLYSYQDPQTERKKLLLLGAGTSDYLDGLFDPGADIVETASLGLSYAYAAFGSTRSACLMQLPESSPLLGAADLPEFQKTLRRGTAEPCSTVKTTLDLPSKVGGNVRRYRRRAEAEGRLAWDVAGTTAEALQSFEQLAVLHGERWEVRGEAGVLADDRVLAHHREAIPALLQADLLRMFRLTRNDELLGVLYALADAPGREDRSLFLYLIGINTRFAELSPGTLLLHAVWEYAREEGFQTLDLLRGGENYKKLWGAREERTSALLWTPGTHP